MQQVDFIRNLEKIAEKTKPIGKLYRIKKSAIKGTKYRF
jgi:hypothetical protein